MDCSNSRLLCPPLSPRVCSNSCPFSWWYYPTISFSASPLFLLPSIFPSIRVFSKESTLHISWPKYWSFSFNIRPSNEQPGLISFRMDWLDLLAVQGTRKSLLQHHSSKTSILQRSAFFTSFNQITRQILGRRLWHSDVLSIWFLILISVQNAQQAVKLVYTCYIFQMMGNKLEYNSGNSIIVVAVVILINR